MAVREICLGGNQFVPISMTPVNYTIKPQQHVYLDVAGSLDATLKVSSNQTHPVFMVAGTPWTLRGLGSKNARVYANGGGWWLPLSQLGDLLNISIKAGGIISHIINRLCSLFREEV